MVELNMADVMKVFGEIIYPIFALFGVIIVTLILRIVLIFFKFEKRVKRLIRGNFSIAILLTLVIVINMLVSGPFAVMANSAMSTGIPTETSTAEALELSKTITGEGIVLLENDNNILPLTEVKKLNVFGWAQVSPCYGGTASASLAAGYETVDLLGGLTNAGFEINTELTDFYKTYMEQRPVVGLNAQDWSLPEPPVSTYTESLISNAKSFSDTAVIVLSRFGGEGADLPIDMSKVQYSDNSSEYKDFDEGEHYLQLSQTEQDMIDLVTANFENVVIVYNGNNTMELDWINNYPQIKGLVWCPGAGQNGFTGLGEILAGQTNPSGRTNDTFVKNLKETPWFNNFGEFTYTNAEDYAYGGTAPHFLNYVEGIYVGYRYYETAYAEAQQGNMQFDYEATVLYPFGYGLSYTEFAQEITKFDVTESEITVTVKVTNTGTVAGKDVVQLYYTPPYTNGGIEKAAVNLVAFAKTEKIEAGASTEVNLSFAIEDMASYDMSGTGGYVLEAGEYGISLRKDAHSVIDTRSYIAETEVRYGSNNTHAGDNLAAENVFSDAAGDVTYLSRKDGFANYAEATAAPSSYDMTEDQKAAFINTGNYNPSDYNNPDDQMPTTGAKNGLMLADLRGLDYDDPKWDLLLDQLTIDEMSDLIGLGGYCTYELDSISKVFTNDLDGPVSVQNNFNRNSTISYPAAAIIANTWNADIAYKYGNSMGKMADEMNASGWYAPGMNIHRSAFEGRNTEYFSEDALMSGKMAAAIIQGAKEHGVYTYVKHFALNEQETQRTGMLCTWADEQTIREIYLKPFELSVKEGNTTAVMSSFNYIGGTWAGGHNGLLNTVLRDEWGFRGMVVTDYFSGAGYMDADIAIRNGGDLMLAPYNSGDNTVSDTESATAVKAMRQASKNILYTVVNSRAYEDVSTISTTTPVESLMLSFNVVSIIILVGLEALLIWKFKRRGSMIKK